jgi:hypothetical protein
VLLPKTPKSEWSQFFGNLKAYKNTYTCTKKCWLEKLERRDKLQDLN